ncbi:MAG: helix-turn-helix domain-containing protein [Terracidiphilus sp.]
MNDIEDALRIELRDPEYSEGYADSFLNAYIATQIKVIREQRQMTQAQLGELIGTTQAGVSRYENVNYSSWSIKSLIRMAHAFDVRLKVSFEPYGTLPEEVIKFNRESLERVKREADLGLMSQHSRIVGSLHPENGNLLFIDMYKVIAATESRNNREPLTKWSESESSQVSSQVALCR